MKTKALVHLQGDPSEATLLKRLALIFDEIHFVLPQAYAFTKEALNDPQIVNKMTDGRIIITQKFNFFDHVGREWSRVLSRKEDAQLLEVIECLKDAGIASEVSERSLLEGRANQSIYRELTNSLISSTLGDEAFERVSETDRSQYDIQQRTMLVEFAPLEGEVEPLRIPFIQPPNLVADIDYITASLLIAETQKLSTIFHVPRHRLELDFLYEKYKIGVECLKDRYPQARYLTDHKLHFGEMAFGITNGIVSSELLAQKSPEEILKLRYSLETARENFLSRGMNELGDLVAGNPWSAATAAEIEKYIDCKLRLGSRDKVSQAA
jgi:hypothetical protein